jgi:hypothetical protein
MGELHGNGPMAVNVFGAGAKRMTGERGGYLQGSLDAWRCTGLMQPARLPLGVPPSGSDGRDYICHKQVRDLVTVVQSYSGSDLRLSPWSRRQQRSSGL